MFSCNNISLLSFTYYLKIILAFNMTILPFIFLEIITIKIIRGKQDNKSIKQIFSRKLKKTIFNVAFIFILSLLTHNLLHQEKNVCYTYANTNIYPKYRNSYLQLENENIDNNTKNTYLENILIGKENTEISTLETKEIVEPEVVLLDNKIEVPYQESDYNHQNHVYIENGVFHYPQYIYGNTSTYSGMNCPNDPLSEGYNNPYGYNNYFYNRLTSFIEEANKNGYKITMSTQGCRNYSTQTYYYNTMERGRAAVPGYSLHGFGIASDLEFYYSDGSVCGYGRTDNSCPSMGWAHQNAERFNLVFPLLYASYKEDWHIEPLNKSKY